MKARRSGAPLRHLFRKRAAWSTRIRRARRRLTKIWFGSPSSIRLRARSLCADRLRSKMRTRTFVSTPIIRRRSADASRSPPGGASSIRLVVNRLARRRRPGSSRGSKSTIRLLACPLPAFRLPGARERTRLLPAKRKTHFAAIGLIWPLRSRGGQSHDRPLALQSVVRYLVRHCVSAIALVPLRYHTFPITSWRKP